MRRFLLLLLFLPGVTHAAPEDAVVRIASHGGSGTIIATGQGWSLLLSCAHCFEGADRNKPIRLDMPHPAPGAPTKVKMRVLAVGRGVDLALVQIDMGPLPYVVPVAPLGTQPKECWSIGFDEMKLPPQKRAARIVSIHGDSYFTDARPWHGRSGGALVDKATGCLVGVTSAYTGPKNHREFHPGANGVYVNHASIVAFIQQQGLLKVDGVPRSPMPAPRVERYKQACPT